MRGPQTSERRGFGRRESFIHAIARLPGRGAEPCVVRNYSDTGALLAFQSDIELPARFRLVIEAKGIDVLCEVRRREGAEVGVSFGDRGEAGARLMEQPQPVPTLASLAAADSEPLPGVVSPAPRVPLLGGIVTIVPAADVRRLAAG